MTRVTLIKNYANVTTILVNQEDKPIRADEIKAIAFYKTVATDKLFK